MDLKVAFTEDLANDGAIIKNRLLLFPLSHHDEPLGVRLGEFEAPICIHILEYLILLLTGIKGDIQVKILKAAIIWSSVVKFGNIAARIVTIHIN